MDIQGCVLKARPLPPRGASAACEPERLGLGGGEPLFSPLLLFFKQIEFLF